MSFENPLVNLEKLSELVAAVDKSLPVPEIEKPKITFTSEHYQSEHLQDPKLIEKLLKMSVTSSFQDHRNVGSKPKTQTAKGAHFEAIEIPVLENLELKPSTRTVLRANTDKKSL